MFKNILIDNFVGYKKKFNIKFFIGLGLVLLALASCEDESSIGIEVLPDGDLLDIRSTTIKEDISSYTFTENLVRTDEAANSLLGSFTDSLFGNTTIDFATQFRLFDFPGFGKNPVADSVKLFLYYRIIYGDTVTPQHFKVYELEESLNPDDTYFQDVDLKPMASDQLLGEVQYTPRVRLDSVRADTFYQLITIPLDISLAEKLISADSLQMINNDVFLEYFKGLYLETEKIETQGGTILSLEAASSNTFQGSAMVMYYKNDDFVEEFGTDTTLIMPYIISQFSARVNRIAHDYSGAPFYEGLNSTETEDSLIYVQSTGGLKAKILIDDLTAWADSTNIGINKAELIFQLDTVASRIDKFMPPLQMLFTIIDEDGNEFLPADYVFSPAFYGGKLRSDYTYHFNITQHLQQIIEGTAKNYGFFLTPAQKNDEANRAVIKGSKSKTGIQLIVTYTKFSS